METAVFKQDCINFKQQDCISNREHIFYQQGYPNDFDNQINCSKEQNYIYSVIQSSGYSAVSWYVQGVRVTQFILTKSSLKVSQNFKTKLLKMSVRNLHWNAMKGHYLFTLQTLFVLLQIKHWWFLLWKCQISCV